MQVAAHRLLSCFILGCAVPVVLLRAQETELPSYVPSHQVAGVIHTWGSPQMSDLLKQYEEGFRRVQPGVTFDDDLKSTITAVAGVYTGRAEIGVLGREIWPIEVQAYRSVVGRDPAVIEVATGSFDVPKATFALMVFVPSSSPLKSLTTGQLERLFGNSGRQPIRTWGDLGLTGAWAHRPIHLYGFSVDNDKSQIFSQLIFQPRERWNSGLHEFVNAADGKGPDAGELIVNAVAADPDGIGISNVHYATSGVKPLALASPGQPVPVVPTKATVADNTYPLTRAVYMVLKQNPSEAAVEFLRFVLSRQGAQAVEREGNYLPITPAASIEQRHILPLSAK